ncbi:Tyrosine 3-monooxygenase [Toxocara canis]|uniref:Tyrosine 3-monooxygenase n=1 Tax=Toxocara canis TaxID=6265 RepID=A0A0B2VQV5_TOXCA|nr:Tyrosine 3-monooxygenase [Toxocara canis]
MTEMDPSKFGARDSLVRQASIDRMQNEGVRRFSMLKHRKELEQQLHSIPDPSKFGARDSLVRQASIDRMQNEGVRRFSMLKHRKELEQQLHSIPDPSKFGARDSLVRQASIDRMQNEGVRRFSMLKHRKELEQQLHSIPIFSQLNDEGIELIWSSKDDVSMIFTAILAGERTLTNYFQSFTLSLKKLSLLAEL